MPTRLMQELVRRTLVRPTEAESLLARIEKESVSLDTILLEDSLVCEKDILSALGVTYGFATAGSKESVESVDDAVFRKFPEQLAVKHGWAPLRFENDGDILKILCTAPPDLKNLRSVGALLELKLKPVLTTEIRVAQRQALLYNRPLPTRLLKLLQEGNGVGNEAIRGPDEQNTEARSSILEKQPISFTEATRQLSEAVERDRIIDIALYYVHRTFSYAALIISKKGSLVGWKAVGRQAEAIEKLSIDTSIRSSFATAFNSQAQVLGPVSQGDKNYLKILGRDHTRTLLLIPLRLGGKVFALLYVDNDSSSISPHHAAELMVFSQHVQKAMERVVLQRKDQLLGTGDLPIPALAEPSKVPEQTASIDPSKAPEQATAIEPSKVPEQTASIEPSEASEQKASIVPTFDPEPAASTSTNAPNEPKEEHPSIRTSKPSIVLPPFPATILPGTLPSPPRVTQEPEDELLDSDFPHIEEAVPEDMTPVEPEKEPTQPLGYDFTDASPESTQDQVPIVFKGHKEPTESSRLRVPAALVDPIEDSLLEEISQLPSFSPPQAPFAEALLAEPKAFSSVIKSDTENHVDHTAERPTMLESLDQTHSPAENHPARDVSRPTLEVPVEETPQRTVSSDHEPTNSEEPETPPTEEEITQSQSVDSKELAKQDEDTPKNQSDDVFVFEPTRLQIHDWIEKLHSVNDDERQAATQDDLARFPGVLPELMKRFPGVVDVDTRLRGTTLPPFAKCGSLLKVISEMSLEAHPFVEPFLKSTQREERFFACYFYGQCHIISIIPQLLLRLHDGDQVISAAAEASLLRYKNEPEFAHVIEHLHQRLNSQSLDSRKRAISYLAKYKDTSVIPKLIQILEKKEKNLMPAAVLGLESLTRQSWGLNAKKWNSWWQKNQRRPRFAWLVDALESKDENVREKALKELVRITGDGFGYVPSASRWGRGRALSRWKGWLKKQI